MAVKWISNDRSFVDSYLHKLIRPVGRWMESQPRTFWTKWVDAAATQKSICPQTYPAIGIDTDTVWGVHQQNGSKVILSHTGTKLWDHFKPPPVGEKYFKWTIQLWIEWKWASQTHQSHCIKHAKWCFHFMLVFPCFISICRWLHNKGDTLGHKTLRQFNLFNEFPLWGTSRGHKLHIGSLRSCSFAVYVRF